MQKKSLKAEAGKASCPDFIEGVSYGREVKKDICRFVFNGNR